MFYSCKLPLVNWGFLTGLAEEKNWGEVHRQPISGSLFNHGLSSLILASLAPSEIIFDIHDWSCKDPQSYKFYLKLGVHIHDFISSTCAWSLSVQIFASSSNMFLDFQQSSPNLF